MKGPGTDPLAAGLAAGDERAFVALYDRFGERLYQAAVGILRRREDAEDAVQETFCAVLRSRDRLTEVQDLKAYLFTTLRRAAARVAVRRARSSAGSQALIDAVPGPADPNLSHATAYGEALEKALSSLPAEQREVLVLKLDSDLTFAEIAQVLGVSVSTLGSRYRYALEKLRNALIDQEKDCRAADRAAEPEKQSVVESLKIP